MGRRAAFRATMAAPAGKPRLPPEPVKQQERAGCMGGKGKILVVDDDRLVLATVAHGLAQAGYEVIDADNGDDAILLAREHKPDLALLDIRMEGKSGFDVAAYLREYLQTPFIFLSAFSDAQTVEQVKALGAVAYLVKPLDIGQIVPTVEAAFANLAARPAQPQQAPGPQQHLSASNDDMAEVIPIAIGILMHRHSLTRGGALDRLHKLATADGRSLHHQAERLVEAVEMLAR